MLVERTLARTAQIQVEFASAATLAGALAQVSTKEFDAILLDLNLPDSRGISTLTSLLERAGDAQIIVLSGTDDDAIGSEAIEKGAADYIVKGDTVGEGLVRRIRLAVDRGQARRPERPPDPRGKVMAFVGSRGGAGVTSVLLNAAATLAGNQVRVVIAELRRIQGSLRQESGITTGRSFADVPPTADNLRVRLVPSNFGVSMLFAPGWTESPIEISREYVETFVDSVARLADIVFLDLTMESPDILQFVIPHCDLLALVMERESTSLGMAKAMLPKFREWMGPSGEIGGVVVTKSPGLDFMPAPAIAQQLGVGLLGIVPPLADQLMSPPRTTPLVIKMPQSVGAAAYRAIAERLAAGLQEVKTLTA
jgi:CheY-like chemotaxis protein/MinD-like ATPase involved in chromosome partitioning or flagellar assembly